MALESYSASHPALGDAATLHTSHTKPSLRTSPEIWAIIFRHATDVPDDISGQSLDAFDGASKGNDVTYPQALNTKKNIMLVSKLFCDLATPLLYESIGLSRSPQVHRLAEVLAWSAEEHRVGFGWWTRKIKLFLFDFTGAVKASSLKASLRRILDLTPRLLVYMDGNAGLPQNPPHPTASSLRRIEWIFGSGPGVECLTSLVQANPRLESLALPGIAPGIITPICAPELKWLDLPLGSGSRPTHWSVLSQWDLPKLTHLTIHAHTLSESDHPAIEELEAFLDVHGKRITYLDLRFSCMMLPAHLSIEGTLLPRLPILKELIFSMRYTPPLGPSGMIHPTLTRIGLRDFTPQRCPSNDCRVWIITRHFADLAERDSRWPSLKSVRLLEADGVEFEKMPLIDASWWNHWIVSWRLRGIRFEDRCGNVITTGRRKAQEWLLTWFMVEFILALSSWISYFFPRSKYALK